MRGSIKRLLAGTPLFPVAKSVNEALVEPAYDRLVARSLSPEGYHRIAPTVDGIPPFELWLPGHGRFQRARIRGELEPEVMAALSEYLDAETTFWEVGAAWGYFTMAAASVADTAVAFESRLELVERIRQSAERNGYTNVTAVAGTVGADVDLAAYPVPDLVVMDIEGWEYETLQQNPELLAANPVLILEVHEPAMVEDDEIPVAPPERTRELLESSSYSVTQLDQRAEHNYHLLAIPQ